MAQYTSYQAFDAFERILRDRCRQYGFRSVKTESNLRLNTLEIEINNDGWGKPREYIVDMNQVRTENDINLKLNVIFDHLFGADTSGLTKVNPHLSKLPAIEDVIYNGPATIVKWSDGTKTIVKCCEDDLFDPEKGLAMAISKKALGDLKEVKKWTKKYEKPDISFVFEHTATTTAEAVEALKNAAKHMINEVFGR